MAGLADTLAGPGSLTVFAPTDSGFHKLLGDDPIKAIMGLSKETLTDLLLYHVVVDHALYFDDLGCDHSLTMANGKKTWT